MDKDVSAEAADPASGANAGGGVDLRYIVPALSRGLQILKVLSGSRCRQTLTEVAVSLGLTRSSAYRLLYTLSHLGFVEYDPRSKTYALAPKILHVGYSYLASRELVEVATPHLVRLRDCTGWSAHLGELQGREVVYVARVATHRTIASNVHVGKRLPAAVTTMGRILLSGLSDADVRHLYDGVEVEPSYGKPTSLADLLKLLAADRISGAVAQDSAYEPGVASVAAPVRDMSGRIIAAVNISAIAMFTNEAELNGPLKQDVLATAHAISHDLGAATPTQPGRVGTPPM